VDASDSRMRYWPCIGRHMDEQLGREEGTNAGKKPQQNEALKPPTTHQQAKQSLIRFAPEG
jgi:hypothetical protein